MRTVSQNSGEPSYIIDAIAVAQGIIYYILYILSELHIFCIFIKRSKLCIGKTYATLASSDCI